MTEIVQAMADGDPAGVLALHAEFGGWIRAALRRDLRRFGVDRIDSDELSGLVIDACFVISDCAGAWHPAGGALPWTWAARRLSGLVSSWVGQHAVAFDADRHDVAAPPPADDSDLVDDLAVLDLLAKSDARTRLVLDALCDVASARDRAVVIEVRTQTVAGDPSPAVTVARRHGLTPDAVRQIASRVRARLRTLAATDPRFEPLADIPLVA